MENSFIRAKNNSNFDISSLNCGKNACPNLQILSSKPTLNSVYNLVIALCSFCLFSMLITISLIDNVDPKKLQKELETKTINRFVYICKLFLNMKLK
jgi:hypothetical protein